MFTYLQFLGKRLIFPGVDLHTRCRYHRLPGFFTAGPVKTLDVGCGNGALSYAAYRIGNRVTGIDHNKSYIDKNRDFFLRIAADPARLNFKVFNLYDLNKIDDKFDQIICSETLEHISDDRLIVSYFHDILHPGGVLHLSVPYALNPEHRSGRSDRSEDGGHVRDGYTMESLESLLVPAGFKIVENIGLGAPFFTKLDKFIRYLRGKIGDFGVVFVFLLVLPLQWSDYFNPSTPYSIYVKAIKEK